MKIDRAKDYTARYVPSGPFVVPFVQLRRGARVIDPQGVRKGGDFWQLLDGEEAGTTFFN
jgi:hypothetical protein